MLHSGAYFAIGSLLWLGLMLAFAACNASLAKPRQHDLGFT
jgi:hypothetical protein